MHARRLLGATVLALAASTVHPVLSGPSPAAAHTGYTSIGDDANADQSVSNINGTTMKVRVLRPNANKPTNGWPLVVYITGEMENRCANVNETSTRASWYTRKAMAEHGYAVLSFNARGMPANYNAGVNPSGTSGCTALGDATDGIDDSGWDLGGPVDKQDIDDLIEWAVASYTPTGCSSPCIDGGKVGLFGYGFDGALKAMLMGVPAATNPQYNSRVDGIVAVGFKEWTIRNLTALSNDGAGTPAWRDIDQGARPWLPDMHRGDWSHADPSVLLNTSEFLADKYLNTSVPSGVAAWLADRTIVDDTGSVDKAEEITTPVFMANAFLDNEAGALAATLAYNKLGATNKYLYLGACGAEYLQLPSADSGPCDDAGTNTNASNLRTKVHEFLDYHVAGNGSALSAKVYWAVPPANPMTTDGWSVATDTAAAWPPNTNTLDSYDITYCLDSAGEWNAGLCSAWTDGTGAGLQDTGDRTVSNVVGGTDPNAPHAYCVGDTYTSTEVVSYTSGTETVDYKMIGYEVDINMGSDDTTRVQVYADLFTVNGSGTETRVSQGGAAAVVPVKRDAVAGSGNTYRFKFKPTGAAWTLQAGHSIRLKIAANYKKDFAQELIPGTYRIKHTDAKPLHLTITWDL